MGTQGKERGDGFAAAGALVVHEPVYAAQFSAAHEGNRGCEFNSAATGFRAFLSRAACHIEGDTQSGWCEYPAMKL